MSCLCGISVDLFIACTNSGNIHISDDLRVLYGRLATVSASFSQHDAILEGGFATTVFSIFHYLVQDRILRYEMVDRNSAEFSALIQPLRTALNCLAAAIQLGHIQTPPFVDVFAAIYADASAGFVGTNAVQVSLSFPINNIICILMLISTQVPFDSLQWYYSLLRGDRSVSFPMPECMSCCPTLKLVKKFFDFLFNSAEITSDE